MTVIKIRRINVMRYLQVSFLIMLVFSLLACEKHNGVDPNNKRAFQKESYEIECCYPGGIYSIYIGEGVLVDSILFENQAACEWLTVNSKMDSLFVDVTANKGESIRRGTFKVYSDRDLCKIYVEQTPVPTMSVEYDVLGTLDSIRFNVILGEGTVDMRFSVIDMDTYLNLLTSENIINYMMNPDNSGIYDYSDYLKASESDEGFIITEWIPNSTIFYFPIDKDGNAGELDETIFM